MQPTGNLTQTGTNGSPSQMSHEQGAEFSVSKLGHREVEGDGGRRQELAMCWAMGWNDNVLDILSKILKINLISFFYPF